jgi:hypothetical protein
MNFSYIRSIKPLFVTNKSGNELLLVPFASNVNQMTDIFTLNETASFIWEHLDKTKDQSEMVKKISSNFDVLPEQAEKDLILFVERFAEMFGSVQR